MTYRRRGYRAVKIVTLGHRGPLGAAIAVQLPSIDLLNGD